jgi:hypothetical protein
MLPSILRGSARQAMAERTQQIPSGMRRAHGRFERWRKSHRGRVPIPETLWKMAAQAASEHGVFRTSQVLRLDYNKLKARASAVHTTRRAPPPTFVELLPSPPSDSPDCLIEIEGPRGKMRIQWKGVTVADIAGLTRILWEPT